MRLMLLLLGGLVLSTRMALATAQQIGKSGENVVSECIKEQVKEQKEQKEKEQKEQKDKKENGKNIEIKDISLKKIKECSINKNHKKIEEQPETYRKESFSDALDALKELIFAGNNDFQKGLNAFFDIPGTGNALSDVLFPGCSSVFQGQINHRSVQHFCNAQAFYGQGIRLILDNPALIIEPLALELVRKYSQTALAIAEGEWKAAASGIASGSQQLNESDRNKLRKDAIDILSQSSHDIYLISLAIASHSNSSERSQQIDRTLKTLQAESWQMRNTIQHIQNGDEPLLPIEDIFVTLDQIENLRRTIVSPLFPTGSIAQAKSSYDNAESEINRSDLAAANRDSDKEALSAKIQEIINKTGFEVERVENSNRQIDKIRIKKDGTVITENLLEKQGRDVFVQKLKEEIDRIINAKIGAITNEEDQQAEQGYLTSLDGLQTRIHSVGFTNELDHNLNLAIDDLYNWRTEYDTTRSYKEKIDIINQKKEKILTAIETSTDDIANELHKMGNEKAAADLVSTAIRGAGAATGAVTGAAIGAAVGGPPGAVAGTISGSLLGAAADGALQAIVTQRTGEQQARIERLRGKLQADIQEANDEASVKSLLSEIRAQLDRQKHAQQLAENALGNVYKIVNDVEHLLDQLDDFIQRKNDLWYNDLLLPVKVLAAKEKANQDQRALMINIFKLGKMLETLWKMEFSNPLRCEGTQGPIQLGNNQEAYRIFSSLNSIFALSEVQFNDTPCLDTTCTDAGRKPYEVAGNFYHALKEWDQRLRDQGCYFTTEDTTLSTDFSLRQDIKGWRDGINDKPEKVALFQKWLSQNEIMNNGKIKGFSISFPLTEDTKSLNGSPIITRENQNIHAWNYRVVGIDMSIAPSRNRRPGPPIQPEIRLAQSGLSYNVGPGPNERCNPGNCPPPKAINLDLYIRYDLMGLNYSARGLPTLYAIDRAGESYRDISPSCKDWARNLVNKYRSGISKSLLSPWCSRWLLEATVDTDTDFDFEAIEDIKIRFCYERGTPPQINWEQ